jgi:ABC-type multidrug transport system fused ATPase/permease subunit
MFTFVSYPITPTHTTQAVRQSAQAQTFLTAVERLHHYTTLPSEGAAHNPSYPPPPNWPPHGELCVQGLHVRYRATLPIVLHGVDALLPAGRKIGVVGRTGSGKSTFLAALLRLNEIVGGDIVVDGVSLTRLGLADARGAVAWIPQQPDLFTGTLR